MYFLAYYNNNANTLRDKKTMNTKIYIVISFPLKQIMP